MASSTNDPQTTSTIRSYYSVITVSDVNAGLS